MTVLTLKEEESSSSTKNGNKHFVVWNGAVVWDTHQWIEIWDQTNKDRPWNPELARELAVQKHMIHHNPIHAVTATVLTAQKIRRQPRRCPYKVGFYQFLYLAYQ